MGVGVRNEGKIPGVEDRWRDCRDNKVCAIGCSWALWNKVKAPCYLLFWTNESEFGKFGINMDLSSMNTKMVRNDNGLHPSFHLIQNPQILQCFNKSISLFIIINWFKSTQQNKNTWRETDWWDWESEQQIQGRKERKGTESQSEFYFIISWLCEDD